MQRQTAFPGWLIVVLIIAGVVATVMFALLLTQLDSLQRRSQLPQEPLEIVNQEATLAASELTVVVIADDDQAGTLLPGATTTPTAVTPLALTPTAAVATPAATVVTPLAPDLDTTCAFQPEDWVPYVVQKGDTLASLALRYGVSVGTLAQANCLIRESLLPGQSIAVPLILPTLATQIACGVPADWVQYTARSGDTLFKLAQQRNTTVSLIMQANCLESTFIEPGSSLYVPPLPPTYKKPDAHGPSDFGTPQRWSGDKTGIMVTSMVIPDHSATTPSPSSADTSLATSAVTPTLRPTRVPDLRVPSPASEAP